MAMRRRRGEITIMRRGRRELAIALGLSCTMGTRALRLASFLNDILVAKTLLARFALSVCDIHNADTLLEFFGAFGRLRELGMARELGMVREFRVVGELWVTRESGWPGVLGILRVLWIFRVFGILRVLGMLGVLGELEVFRATRLQR
ncbi:hypothetical protein DL93DRAFT_721979 [Clavulina sp. PMI_390]|nr:hypothetical protein DL93DRAFT_721979 [Clavulina sp. PMI_390]